MPEMVKTESAIMALVERIQQTSQAIQTAGAERLAAAEALRVAESKLQQASLDFELAQNALLVAAGGTDRSWMWRETEAAEPKAKGNRADA